MHKVVRCAPSTVKVWTCFLSFESRMNQESREDLKVQGARSALRDEDGKEVVFFFVPYIWMVIT